MGQRLRLGVVGVGHLGKEHARVLAGLGDVELVGVADANPAQARLVAERCGTRAFADHAALAPHLDAAVLAVPTAHHHPVARDLLDRGLHLLIEKPLAANLEEADGLVGLAARRGAVLQVGHIERFNPAFEELQRRPLRPRFIDCERCGGFTGRSTDVGAVLDLMIHDLDLVLALTRAPVRAVEALGVAVLGGHEDVAQARVRFADGCVAQFRVSRVSPAPSRRMHVWAPEGFVAVDFGRKRLTLTRPADHLRGGAVDSRRLDPALRASLQAELHGKHLLTREVECRADDDQLTCELKEFVRCARTGERPRVDGADGRGAVALAERILDSLRGHAWNGDPTGPVGPRDLPASSGELFEVPGVAAAA